MDPALAAVLSVLAGAVAVAITTWATWRFPRGYHRDEHGGSVPNEEVRDEPTA